MVNSLAPYTEACGTPDVTGRLCERESPTQTWLFLCSMYNWNHLKAAERSRDTRTVRFPASGCLVCRS